MLKGHTGYCCPLPGEAGKDGAPLTLQDTGQPFIWKLKYTDPDLILFKNQNMTEKKATLGR